MIGLILIIVLVVFLLGGVGPWAPRGYGYGYGTPGIGIIGVILLVILLLYMLGRI